LGGRVMQHPEIADRIMDIRAVEYGSWAPVPPRSNSSAREPETAGFRRLRSRPTPSTGWGQQVGNKRNRCPPRLGRVFQWKNPLPRPKRQTRRDRPKRRTATRNPLVPGSNPGGPIRKPPQMAAFVLSKPPRETQLLYRRGYTGRACVRVNSSRLPGATWNYSTTRTSEYAAPTLKDSACKTRRRRRPAVGTRS